MGARAQLAKALIERHELKPAVAMDMVNTVIDELVELIRSRDKVYVYNFGTFKNLIKEPRRIEAKGGRQEMIVPKRRFVKFKASKYLRRYP